MIPVSQRKILFEQLDDFGYKLDYTLQQMIRVKLANFADLYTFFSRLSKVRIAEID